MTEPKSNGPYVYEDRHGNLSVAVRQGTAESGLWQTVASGSCYRWDALNVTRCAPLDLAAALKGAKWLSEN